MSLLSNLAEISAIILTFVFFCMIANTFFPKGKHYHFSGIVLFGIVELCLGLVPADLLPNIVFSLLTMLLSFLVLLLFFDGAFWKKAIQAKQDLEIARKALITTYARGFTKSDAVGILQRNNMTISKALKQIEHKEQQ